LNENDSQALLDLLLEFKAQGMTHDHDLAQAQRDCRVADSITVMRDGSTVSTMDCSDARSTRTASSATWSGRDMADRYPAPRAEDRRDDLRGQGLGRLSPAACRPAIDQGREFQRAPGEMWASPGLMGAGRTELAMSLSSAAATASNISGEG
jgi:putative multiple sugar transport system ATP-binding protein